MFPSEDTPKPPVQQAQPPYPPFEMKVNLFLIIFKNFFLKIFILILKHSDKEHIKLI